MISALERNKVRPVRGYSKGLEVEECPKALLFFIKIQRRSSDKMIFKQRSIGIKRRSKKYRCQAEEYSSQKEQQVPRI